MKKNYLKLLPLILTFPTLMANASAPQVFRKEYKDYQLTYVSYVQNGEYFDYTYHLKNTGKGYISYLRLEYETRETYYGVSYYAESRNIFRDSVIEPGFDQDIVMTSWKEIPDVKRLKAECEGFALFDESVVVSGTKAVTLKNKYSDAFYYVVDLALEYNDSNYNYGAILKLNYNDNIYYVKVDERGGYIIETSEKLDLEKLTLLDVTVVKSRPYMYGVMDGFLIVAIVFLVCFGIVVSAGIFCAIFFPAMKRRKRARRLAAEQNK